MNVLDLDCFLAKGQITFALQDYEQAMEITPNNNEVKLRISNVYFNKAEREYKEKRYQVLPGF
jgi:tetratricopeptide (TPR) repeat protein